MTDTELTSNSGYSKIKISGWGYRHQQCFILFWTYIIAFSMKSCIGMTLVAMTKDHKSNIGKFEVDNATEEFKPDGFLNALILVPPYPTFQWSKKVQETVIASFYWGDMLLQLPAGYLTHRFEARYLLSGTMMINSIVCFLFPVASFYGGWYSALICRIAQGIGQALIAPGIHTFLGKWTPLHERARLSTFIFGGQAFGIVLGLPLTGFISASVIGWPGLFRVYGLISGTTAMIIWFLLRNTPAEHPKISYVEKKYIEDDVGTCEREKKLPVPWLKILRHKGVYAIMAAHLGTIWGNFTLYTEVPLYMDKVMKVNIKANGLLTALPFLVMWFTGFFFSWLTDWIIINKIISVTNARKFANSLGYIPAGIGMLAVAYAPLNIYAVETILIVIGAFKISSYCGFLVNHIDITPNFSGTTMSLCNFVSTISTSLSPLLIGSILTDVEDKYLWRQVFFLAAGVYLITNLIYVTLGTSERAEWNEPKIKERENVEEMLPIMN